MHPFRSHGGVPRGGRRQMVHARSLRLEPLEPRLLLTLILAGQHAAASPEPAMVATQESLSDSAERAIAEAIESGTKLFCELWEVTEWVAEPRLTELAPSDLFAVQKAIVAGDPNGIPPDSPADRIDPNTPDSPYAGVGSLAIDTGSGTLICTATAIGPSHVLAAAHCLDLDDDGSIDVAPSNVTFNLNLDSGPEPTYAITAQELHVHPDWTGFENPSVNDDIAVIELVTELPAGVPIYAMDDTPFDTVETATLVGYGESGNGNDGYTIAASTTAKRTGRNVMEYHYADDEGSGVREIYEYDFDEPDSSSTLGNAIETTIGPGDSGGPAFIDDGSGGLKIFGINTYTFQFASNTPPAPLFGSGGGGMVVSAYRSFIDPIVRGIEVTITPTDGTTEVVERGSTDNYHVVLGAAPTADVTVDIVPDFQLTATPLQLTFTQQNWDIPQEVVVQAIDDSASEGPHIGRIAHAATSNDAGYDGIAIDTLTARITDDDWSLEDALFVDLGTSDNVAWDQPRVAVQLLTMDSGGVVGPGIFNTWLLDTSSNSTMAFATAVDDMDDPPYVYETEGKFLEYGVAGEHIFDISAAYQFDYAGTSGVRNTLLDTRILSDPDNDISILGPWGIVGMSAMADRVTTFDFSVWTVVDIYDLYMGVAFLDSVPPGDGNRYSVAVDNRITWTPDGQVIEGNYPPVWADVPFLTAIPVHNGVAAGGNFIYDSGAQLSVLSTRMATEIGLDSNNDGKLDHNDANFARYEVVGGVGGIIAAPVFLFDEVHVPTQQGPDLLWTELQWLVLDITDSLDGVFGFDLMTSGWIEAFAVDGDSGYIMQSQLDFREMDNAGTGVVHVDLNPEVNQVIDPNGPGARIIPTGGSTTVSEIGVEDTYGIVLTQQPLHDVRIDLVNSKNQLTAVDDANPDQSFLVFTPANWDIAQTVRVAAVDDTLVENFHRSSIRHISSSADEAYEGVGIRRVITNIIDNDYPGVMIIPSDGITEVSEGGHTDTYDVVLTYPPSQDVTIFLEHAQGQLDVVSADSLAGDRYLVFTADNWDVPQTVLVTATDDDVQEGAHEAYVTHRISTADSGYGDAFALQEYVLIHDIDFTLSPSTINENTDTSAADVAVGTLTGSGDDGAAAYTFSLVGGAGDTDNARFVIDGDQLKVRQGTVLDYEQQNIFSVRVNVDDGNDNFARPVAVRVNNLLEVERVVVGDGTGSRSMVTQLAVTFDQIVTIDGAAFALNQRGGSDVGGVEYSLSHDTGVTIATLTFTGSLTDFRSGSLKDGNYDLTIEGARVANSAGDLLDGDRDGIAGGDFVFGDAESDAFFRFFGDRDGDRDIDFVDFAHFSATFGKSDSDAGFDKRFDWDADGDVDFVDFAHFSGNFGGDMPFN